MKLVLAGLAAAAALGGAFALHGPAARPAPAPHVLRAPPLRTAGGYLHTEMLWKVNGHWGRAWRTLYPLHRRVASQRTFVACEQQTPFSAPLRSVVVLGVRRAPVHVAGLSRTVAGAAVTVRVRLAWYGTRDPITFTHTFHLVPVRGRWTWLLSPASYRVYRNDLCGSSMPAA
jgi:hypothetical protein